MTTEGKVFKHQGDVQVLEAKMPANAKKVDNKPIALGEKSGHMHVVTGDVELFEDESGNMFASIGEGGALLQHVHDSVFNGDYSTNKQFQIADHKSVTLKPNTTFMFGIHKRFNPFQKVWEKVID
jgi:hypothetical protein